jgi:probable rRNA maturation factor
MLSLAWESAARARLEECEVRALRRRLARMLRAVKLSEHLDEELELAVRITGDDEIHALNRDFRGVDKPTDVLAFAQREGEGAELHPEILGDIVISIETAARQQRKGLFFELLFLCAHGLCHLLGYDHQTDEEEAEMDARVAALLAETARRGPVRAA